MKTRIYATPAVKGLMRAKVAAHMERKQLLLSDVARQGCGP